MSLGQNEFDALAKRHEAASAFDLSSKKVESTTIADIAYLRQTLAMASLVSTHDQPHEWIHRVALFNRAWSILLSSLQLVRCRVPMDAFTLLRTALEAVAVGVQLSQDSQAYAKYVTNALNSPKSIGPTAKEIPYFGKVYGLLSKIAVHPNAGTYGPLFSGDGTPSVQLFHDELDRGNDQAALCLVSLVSLLAFRAAELALFEPAARKNGWLQTFGGTHVVNPLAQGLINKKYAQFEALPKPPPNKGMQADFE
jgi:hypothetical protein